MYNVTYPQTFLHQKKFSSYQHFLQYIQEKGFSRFSITSESEILSKYGKTITMIVLAMVNGILLSILSTRQSWKKKPSVSMALTSLLQKETSSSTIAESTPNISQEAINQSIAFLERQKEANCPCTIHTQKRGYDWIVFN